MANDLQGSLYLVFKQAAKEAFDAIEYVPSDAELNHLANLYAKQKSSDEGTLEHKSYDVAVEANLARFSEAKRKKFKKVLADGIERFLILLLKAVL